MDLAVFLVIAGGAGALGLWLGMRFAHKMGIKADVPPARRARSLVVLGAMLALGLLAAWAITNGHAAVGIGILVAIYVVPILVMIPVRIRQSNQRAREARARREAL